MRKLRSLLRSAPREVLDELVREGWIVEVTRSNHVRWVHPNGSIIISSSTPSDWRSWANHLSRMRRARRARSA